MGSALHLVAGTVALKKIRYRDVGGTVHAFKGGKVRTAAGLKDFFASFSLTLTTNELFGAAYKSTTPIFTTPVSVNIIGGAGTPAYSWARTDGGPHSFIISGATSRTASFGAVLGAGQTWTASFACTVTKGGQTLTTPDVNVTIQNESYS
jgi:hypothetical protein